MKLAIALVCFFALGIVLSSLDGSTLHDSNENDRADKSGLDGKDAGKISWSTDLKKCSDRSRNSGKPMFVLAQTENHKSKFEQYRKTTLSNPLVVEAIEALFVPHIDNDHSQSESEVSLVRYMSSDQKELLQKNSDDLTTDATIDQMIKALTANGNQVPNYLYTLKSPSNPKTKVAEFAMHCYWEGEVRLGSISGVHSTRSGWRNGLEVVQLHYSPDLVDYETLLTNAQSFECASKVFTHSESQFEIAQRLVGDRAVKVSGSMRDAKASDQKYYLSHTAFKHLPLTEIQATKINSATRMKKPVDQILSPRQKSLFVQIKKVLKADPSALRNFVYPEEMEQLASYNDRLVAKLDQLSK